MPMTTWRFLNKLIKVNKGIVSQTFMLVFYNIKFNEINTFLFFVTKIVKVFNTLILI